MNITSIEVKTTYRINFTIYEFIQLIESYQTSMDKHKYPRAFEDLDILDEIDQDEVQTFFKKMGVIGNTDLFNLIANWFGFDGWANAGYYNEKKEIYCMSVYNNGDTMN